MTTTTEPEQCAICWEPETIVDIIKTLCGHTYCSACFDTHFSRHDQCPICRTNVYPLWTKMGKMLSRPPRAAVDTGSSNEYAANVAALRAPSPTPSTGLTPENFEMFYTGKFWYDMHRHHASLQRLINRHPDARGARDLEFGYRLDDMAYIKKKDLIPAAMAAMHWVVPRRIVSMGPEGGRAICRGWWHRAANKIRKVIEKNNQKKMKGSKLLDKLEKACGAGNHHDRFQLKRPSEGIHYAPWVMEQMYEHQRADFDTHLEWVLHRIVEVAQDAHVQKFGL